MNPRFSRLVVWLFWLAIPLLGPGCAHVHEVTLVAAARPDAAAHISYSVRDLSKISTSNSPATDAAQNCVRTALSAKGMYESPATVEPDVEVAFVYVNMRTKHKMSTMGQAVFEPISDSRRDEDRYPLQPIVVGYPPHHIEQITYKKELHLIATEKKATRPEAKPRVWDISVSYEDRDLDMEKARPLLAAAVCDRIGENTDGPITIHLCDKDEVIAFIKRGL